MSQDSHELRMLEALLFASPEPVDEVTLTARLPEGTDIGGLIAELRAHYQDRGVNLVRIAGKWAFRTAPDMAGLLRIETSVVRKLSRAAVETLAIIAYHQPVTRAEVEEIRGVAVSRGTIDILLEAGWIKPRGRRRTPGRPMTWATNDKFLEHFGLDNVGDLPGIDDLKAAGLLDSGPVFGISTGPEPELALGDAPAEDEPDMSVEPEDLVQNDIDEEDVDEGDDHQTGSALPEAVADSAGPARTDATPY
ncbi:MAG: SMC-Scp complex subunit ScpB [Alphaproteobacteria bacterium]